MQPRLGIEILSRKSQVIFHGTNFNRCLPESRVASRLDHGPIRFDQLLRRAEVVVLVEIVLAALLQPERIRGPGGVRFVTVGPDFIADSIVFRHQSFIGVEEGGSASADLFPQPPPEGIVGIFGDSAAVDILHLDQPVLGVVAIREHHRAVQQELGGVAVLVVFILRADRNLEFVVVAISELPWSAVLQFRTEKRKLLSHYQKFVRKMSLRLLKIFQLVYQSSGRRVFLKVQNLQRKSMALEFRLR